jgi:secreted PhoX family phosphatase
MKHEAATVVTSKDGRAVVYTGDDERFDYVYKFISADKIDTKDRTKNANILDRGTLYVAKFNDNGSGEWLPMIQGQGPLTAAVGFASQGDVSINTRGAADLLGATKMDRPEDIETNPVNHKVYAAMTNNTNRTVDQLNRANPRASNRHGHVIEFTEAGDDPASTSFTWNIFIQAGDPKLPADNTFFAGFDETKVSWISSPDNVAFGPGSTLWIATDGQPGTLKTADALYAVPVDGEERGWLRCFMTVPVGAEFCGPEFTPDGTTLFAAVQHPGDATGSTIETPASRWPDNTSPPRGAIVAVVKTGGGAIGS